LAVFITVLSTVSGVDKGIRRLSEMNVLLALVLMLWVLFSGQTHQLLNALVQNIGDFFSRFPGMMMNTFAYTDGAADLGYPSDQWMADWTLFFWAWWIAWAPFVSLFLARISRGRTLRQFVVGVLLIPFSFILLWVSIFGNAALPPAPVCRGFPAAPPLVLPAVGVLRPHPRPMLPRRRSVPRPPRQPPRPLVLPPPRAVPGRSLRRPGRANRQSPRRNPFLFS